MHDLNKMLLQKLHFVQSGSPESICECMKEEQGRSSQQTCGIVSDNLLPFPRDGNWNSRSMSIWRSSSHLVTRKTIMQFIFKNVNHGNWVCIIIIIITIIINNFCIALFSGVHKLTVLYNILQHFPIDKKIEGNMFKPYIYMTTSNAHIYIWEAEI